MIAHDQMRAPEGHHIRITLPASHTVGYIDLTSDQYVELRCGTLVVVSFVPVPVVEPPAGVDPGPAAEEVTRVEKFYGPGSWAQVHIVKDR